MRDDHKNAEACFVNENVYTSLSPPELSHCLRMPVLACGDARL